jgi:uncharacterized protein
VKCFYHSADLDGHCSGAIVKYFYPDCEMFPINYGQDFPWDKITNPEEEVFMVDFCLQPFDYMERLNIICHLIWIDHHKTAMDEASRRSFLPFNQILREGLGACALTWEYCLFRRADGNGVKNLEGPPLAVRLLAEYDVWNHTNPMTLPFQYGMRLKETWPEKSMNLWEDLFTGGLDACGVIATAGNTVLEYEDQTNAKFCKSYAFETLMPAYPVELAGPTAAYLPPMAMAICVNKGLTNSKVFDSVWNPKRHDLMITFCRLPLPRHQWTVSLYSDKSEIDCGAIAKAFGGGGHKGAAGFQCDELPFEY